MYRLNFYLLIGIILMLTACGNDHSNKKPGTTAEAIVEQPSNSVAKDNGLVKVASNNSVDATYKKLVNAIKMNDALSIIAQLDHQKNAASVGMELRPTRVLMFGNPSLGTPLMQAAQTAGLDLPQKILVYEDADGKVFIVYNDPFYLAERHGIEERDEQLNTISTALQNLANAATSSDDGR